MLCKMEDAVHKGADGAATIPEAQSHQSRTQMMDTSNSYLRSRYYPCQVMRVPKCAVHWRHERRCALKIGSVSKATEWSPDDNMKFSMCAFVKMAEMP